MGGPTASNGPIRLRAFRSFPCGTNLQRGLKGNPTEGSFTLLDNLVINACRYPVNNHVNNQENQKSDKYAYWK